MTEPDKDPVESRDVTRANRQVGAQDGSDREPDAHEPPSQAMASTRSIALAVLAASGGELGFLLAANRLLEGSNGFVLAALLPLVLAIVAACQFAVGLVLGATLRTGAGMPGVALGVPLGVGLTFWFEPTGGTLGLVALVSLVFLTFALPGYAAGVRIRRGRIDEARSRPSRIAPFAVLAGLAVIGAVGAMGAPMPAIPAGEPEQVHTVTVAGTSISVEPATLAEGSVTFRLRWADYSPAYRIYLIGPIRASDEARLQAGDTGWANEYLTGPFSTSTTGEYWSGTNADLSSASLGTMAVRSGHYAWFVTRSGAVPTGSEAPVGIDDVLAWAFFEVE
jgi:hypothetical protein